MARKKNSLRNLTKPSDFTNEDKQYVFLKSQQLPMDMSEEIKAETLAKSVASASNDIGNVNPRAIRQVLHRLQRLACPA